MSKLEETKQRADYHFFIFMLRELICSYDDLSFGLVSFDCQLQLLELGPQPLIPSLGKTYLLMANQTTNIPRIMRMSFIGFLFYGFYPAK